VPLAVGVLAGNIPGGLAATVGALQAAFADRPGPYRLRILRMLGTAFAAGLTSGLAVVASRSDAASVALLLVVAFIAGLLLSGGPSATQVGVAATAAALVLGHLPQSPSVALQVGLLVFAGGAVQTVLAIAAWPLRRHRPERLALAGLYRELARAARVHRGTSAGPPAGDTLLAVRQVLYGLGHDHGPSVEAYRVLLDEAERIRREISVLGAGAERLSDGHEPGLADQLRNALAAAAAVLDEIASALERGQPVRSEPLDGAREIVRHTVAALEDAAGSVELTRRATAARLRAFGGQLRAVVETTRTGATEGRGGEQLGGRDGYLLRDPIAVLRANLHPGSAVLRHAMRLAPLVAVSDLVVRLVNVERGYWLPLTLLVVLRPDFASTLQRSALRTAGTLLGLLLATGLVHWVPGGDWYRVALIAVLAFGMRLAGPGNFGLSAVCLSGLVVVLLVVNGVPAHTTVVSRMLATVSGGALAVLATLALPAWERQYVPARSAQLVRAYREYLQAVADPGSDRATLQRTRAACRRARSNAQASVDRARSEPVRGHAEVELGRTVLAHTHRFIHAMLSVDAVRPAVRRAGEVPALSAFLSAAGDALGAAEAAISADRAPDATTKLRPLHEDLAAALTASSYDAETAATLLEATDRITNSLDTLLDELRRQLPLTSGG
jgi:uncharacterized membrane protein YccC